MRVVRHLQNNNSKLLKHYVHNDTLENLEFWARVQSGVRIFVVARMRLTSARSTFQLRVFLLYLFTHKTAMRRAEYK